MEQKGLRKLLNDLKEDFKKSETDNSYQMPLFFVLDNFLDNDFRGEQITDRTFRFIVEDEKEYEYELTMWFDEDIMNIFTVSHLSDRMKKMRLEIKRKDPKQSSLKSEI